MQPAETDAVCVERAKCRLDKVLKLVHTELLLKTQGVYIQFERDCRAREVIPLTKEARLRMDRMESDHRHLHRTDKGRWDVTVGPLSLKPTQGS